MNSSEDAVAWTSVRGRGLRFLSEKISYPEVHISTLVIIGFLGVVK